MSKKKNNKKKRKNTNHTSHINKSSQVKDLVENITTEASYKETSQELNSDKSVISDIKEVDENTNKLDHTNNTDKNNITTEVDQKNINTEEISTTNPEQTNIESRNENTDTQNIKIETQDPHQIPKEEQQINKKNDSQCIYKDKRVITACAITALISSVVSIIGTNLAHSKPLRNNETNIEDIENMISIEKIGNELETKKLINSQAMFTIDHTFDSRFEMFRNNILEIYTKASNSDENFQEVFIIKNDDPSKVEEYLNIYKENLINKYKNNVEFKETFSIVKDTIIKSEKGITYFIASNNKEDIEKVITNEINI